MISGCSLPTDDEKSLGSQYNPGSYDYTVNEEKALYVSASSGNDDNNGSSGAPFATVLKALDTAAGGEVIYVADGDYGDLRFGAGEKSYKGHYPPIDEVFTDWVTLLPWGDAAPSFNAVTIGTIAASAEDNTDMSFSTKGNSDLRLRIDGFTMNDGLIIRGSRYVDIRNCNINRSSYYNWTTETERYDCVTDCHAVLVMNGRYITMLDNDINEAGVGIWLMSRDFVFKGNDVHNLMHDGIQFHGGENLLIEGNVIHDLDDGCPSGDYDMHVDGMHISKVSGGGKYATELNDLTIRNNLIYHCECMGIMLQWSSTTSCSNFLWENNIFGPSGGTLVHFGAGVADKFVVRHNTVVYTPNDMWTSDQGRTFGTTEKHEFDDPTSWAYLFLVYSMTGNDHYRIYNNILTTSRTLSNSSDSEKQYAGYLGGNIFYNLTKDYELDDEQGIVTTTLPYEEVAGDIQDVIDNGKIPGVLYSGSAAVDAGTTDPDTESCDEDFRGNLRDSNVDIGACEL